MSNNRALKIAERLRSASDESASLDSRLRNIDKLVRIRGGLGYPTKKSVRLILSAIRLTVDGQLKRAEIDEPTFEGWIDRIDVLDDRLTETTANRRARIQTQKVHKKILEAKIAEISAHPPREPFALPVEFKSRFRWRYRIDETGEVRWQLNEF